MSLLTLTDAVTPQLIVHISAGSLAILSGAAALSVRKGAGLHRVFGTIFFLSILAMHVMGAYLAVLIPQRATAVVNGHPGRGHKVERKEALNVCSCGLNTVRNFSGV